MEKHFDIIILGAGASGISCAISALSRNKSVAVLEHNSLPLKKVKISGGGRCNFTNLNAQSSNYVTLKEPKNKNIIKATLKNFSPNDFLHIINKHKIKYVEKAKGQLFSDTSSERIIDVLMKEAQKAKIFFNIKINQIDKSKEIYNIKTDKGLYTASSLVVATGGMSYQNIGATDIGYKIARQFGLKTTSYLPALVPFNLDNETMKKTIKLKGISLDCQIECNNMKFCDGMLFTHFGISGPAVLQTSLYWRNGDTIKINMLPEIDVKKELKSIRDGGSKGKKISSILTKYLPAKLVEFVIDDKDCFISEAGNKLIDSISANISEWKVAPIGTQGFKLAEVTLGGVDLDEISETFEAKKSKGLFFIGEVLDVAGQLGGYNLQWAWSSGAIAGKYA